MMFNRTGTIKFMNFQGRINRFQFLIASVGLYVLLGASIYFAMEIWGFFEKFYLVLIFRALTVFFLTVFSLSFFSIMIRRFHDIGKRWFFAPLIIVPIYNVYLFVILYVREGEGELNEFGPPVGVA